MNLKKISTVMMSGVMAVTLCTAMPSSQDSGNMYKSRINQALENLSLKAEPLKASATENFRRPVSNEQPMWIVHIDAWNYADPAKIIDLIPEDVLPYVVFNISLSINWDRDNHKWLMVQDGYETAKSWLRTCADKGVWTMIQPSSGGQCHFPDYSADYDLDNTIFGEFFRDYPNFLGYNYCEQFWGFEQEDFPITCADRYRHFAALLKLCNKYGGYLDVSWCGNQWSPKINPLAMLKQVPEWESACRQYSDNFILEEKYTQGSYIADMESLVYGYFISGYCGNFGVRYDETGWTDRSSDGKEALPSKDQYRVVTGLPIFLERMVKNGATVIDGPELVWADDFKEVGGKKDSDGYSVRTWEMHDQYQNDIIDLFRKVQDGTIRIPDRKETVENTKLVVIQDVADGAGKTWDEPYSTYPSLFEGLYRMSNDGNLRDNTILYKSTGTYQTIPTVYSLKDDLAKSIPVQVKQSEIASRWPDIETKQAEFNKLYSSDYWGNCYAGRNENTWVTYNPDKNGAPAGGFLSLKYNTCKQLEVTFSERATALINEYSDHIDIYTNNYDEDDKTTLKTNTFKIYGCKSEPEITYKDRGINQAETQISTSYSDGTYTITVKHNGPVDISVKCQGSETNRLTSYKTAKLTEPEFPDFYEGIRQYEGEFFDSKNIEGNVTNGCNSGITGFQGQGFMKFGTKSDAAVKDTVTTQKAGKFKMNLRYAVTSDINNVDLYVNGSKVKTLSLSKGSSLSDWKTVSQQIDLKEGENKIELKAASALSSSLYLDNFTVEGDFGDSEAKPAEPINGILIKNLIVADSDHAENWSVQYDFNKGSQIFGDRNFTCTDLPSELTGAEYIRTACDSKTVTSDLGTFTAGDDITIYIATDTRVVPILPDWLANWEKSDGSISATNDLTFELYKKSFKAGDTVTLGMNGGTGNNVNYIVLAKKTDSLTTTATTTTTTKATTSEFLAGDANLDGKVNISDAIAVASFVGEPDKNPIEAQGIINGDIHNSGDGITSGDVFAIQQYLAQIITELPTNK